MPHFFITTPIYYSNGVPHIGHAYSSLLADTIARYQKSRGQEVKFSTGVDENSQKVVESAESLGMTTMDYADMMADKHRAVWDGLGIEYTDFIRTTESRHRDFVQKVLQRSYENGDVYEGVYRGLYCVGCEAFKKESDLVDGKCPDHPNKSLQHLEEKNYFFRLSRYQDRLLEFYGSHPDFITPRSRFAEVIEFVRGGLEDFSVSRETNKFGIPLPFDPEQVTYVWYDALFNYLTVCQGEEEKWWTGNNGQWAIGNGQGMMDKGQKKIKASITTANCQLPTANGNTVLHVLGKEIARFHAVFWPAMLWSAGYELPTQLLVTGWMTVDGQKMSKSIGNVIDPVEYIEKYGKEVLLLYLFTAFPIGEDGNFDQKEALLQYNARLANNLGNLLNRVLVLTLKLGGTLHSHVIEGESSFLDSTRYDQILDSLDRYDMKGALDSCFTLLDEANAYITMREPWQTIRDEYRRDETETTLSTVAEALRRVGLCLWSFFPEKMEEMLARIGLSDYGSRLTHGEFITLFAETPDFGVMEKGLPLFARIETGEK